MTPERCKELLPVMQAFAEGKTIEFVNLQTNIWEPIWGPLWTDGVQYRIAPEHPKPKLVLWTQKTCPVGAVARHNNDSLQYPRLITAAFSDRCLVGERRQDYESMALNCVWLWPQEAHEGKVAWRPCGTVVEEKEVA